jgi:flagellar protein FlaG
MEIRGASQVVTSYAANSSEKNMSVAVEKNVSEGNNAFRTQDLKTREIKEVDVQKAVDKLNKFLEDDKTHAEYEIHPTFKNDVMIKIVDDKTGNVVLEVPPKKILDMIAKMCEMVGVMVDKKA